MKRPMFSKIKVKEEDIKMMKEIDRTMRIELSPNDGFYSWDELVGLVNEFRNLGWEIETLSTLGGYKFFIIKHFKQKVRE